MADSFGTKGNDTFVGTAGADTYHYGAVTFNGGTIIAANGFDTLNNSGGGYDALVFDGMSINHIFGERSGDDFVLKIQATTDWDEPTDPPVGGLTIQNLYSGGADTLLERVNFSDAYIILSLEGQVLKVEIHEPGGAVVETNYIGTAGDDTITGASGTDVLSGEGGNDTLNGLVGNDQLDGGAGNDTLAGGTGNDSIDGGIGVDTVDYSGASGTVEVNLSAAPYAANTVASGRPSAQLNAFSAQGADGNDALAFIENVIGSGYGDLLIGGSTGNDIRGGAGADFLVGRQGGDTLHGGIGNDTLFGSNGNSGVDPLAGGIADGVDTLYGEEGNDQLRGNAGDDLLYGGEGDDNLRGDGGSDLHDGGNGNDVVSFRFDEITGLSAGIQFDASSIGGMVTDLFIGDGLGGNDHLISIERVSLTGTAFADTFIGSQGDDQLDGNGGDDILSGGNGNDLLRGFGDNDNLHGDAGNDTFDGGAGNDTLYGGEGFDIFTGGAGNDFIDGGAILDRINLDDLNSVTYATSPQGVGVVVNLQEGTAADGLGGTDALVNINWVTGSSGNDTITGSSNLIFEQIEGGAGDDILDGGKITDLVNVVNGNRVHYGGAGSSVTVDLDTTLAGGLDGGAVSRATGGGGNDTLFNFNVVRGSNGFGDFLYGSDRTDVTESFEGLGGNDFIDGRGGFDSIRYDNQQGTGVTVNLATGLATRSDGTETDTFANIEGVRGSPFADTLLGGNGANDALEAFRGQGGSDFIDGGSGFDRAEYNNSRAGVSVTLGLNGADGSAADGYGSFDTLRSIEAVSGSSHGDSIVGNELANALDGFDGDDMLAGGDGNDLLSGAAGNDELDGGSGVDVAIYGAARAATTFSATATGRTVSSAVDGNDTLTNVERLRFSDISVAVDLSANAGTVAKILGAVFGKAEVSNEVYVGIGLYYMDAGMAYESLMQLAIDARLGSGASHQAVVDLLYTNVVGVPPGDADRGYFVGLLDGGAFTVAGLGVMAADIDLNVANIDLVGLTQQGLEYAPYLGG